MLPVLFKIGSFEMHSYGLFIVAGFFAGLAILVKNGKREGLKGEHLVDISFLGLISGLIGARALFIVTQWQVFMLTFMLADQTQRTALTFLKEIFSFWNGGFVFYGGLIAGTAAFVLRAWTLNIPVFKILDITAPGLALGHAVGRIGCFLAGCCFGKACPPDHPLAVTFSHPDTLAPQVHEPYQGKITPRSIRFVVSCL